MDFINDLEELKAEIDGENRSNIINMMEKKISQNIKEISKTNQFYNLPLNHIFSIISNANFSIIDENIVNILQNIISNTIKFHKNEKETLLLLQFFNIENCSLSLEDYIQIIKSFTNCVVLVKLCDLYDQNNKEVDFDYEYELNQKEKIITKMKKELEFSHKAILKSNKNHRKTARVFPPITEKPDNFISDIFQACKEGNLPSVQYLIEKMNVDKNQMYNLVYDSFSFDSELLPNDRPIHAAVQFGNLPIVEYLIQEQNVDTEIKGCNGWTPLHEACLLGSLDIVKYLIEDANANKEAQDNDGWTPLHNACNNGHIEIVKYLIEDANVNTEPEDIYGKTPLYYATKNKLNSTVDYLVFNVGLSPINLQQ